MLELILPVVWRLDTFEALEEHYDALGMSDAIWNIDLADTVVPFPAELTVYASPGGAGFQFPTGEIDWPMKLADHNARREEMAIELLARARYMVEHEGDDVYPELRLEPGNVGFVCAVHENLFRIGRPAPR